MAKTAKRHDTFTASDGRLLHAHVWPPAAATSARAVFLHGISSHAGWYERGNAHLAAAGIEVHFLNRRGSGVDDRSRGDIDQWRTWIDDVADYLRKLHVESSKTIALCGISWGGKLAAAVARDHPSAVCALGLICPGLYSPFEPGPLTQLLLRAPLPHRLLNRQIDIPLRDPALFTGTPSWQQYIADDPQTLREITLRFAQEDRRLTCYAREAAPHLHMPVLLMLAGRDRIIDNARVRDFYARIPGDQNTLLEYPDATHTLEFEPNPAQYLNDLTRWILYSAAE